MPKASLPCSCSSLHGKGSRLVYELIFQLAHTPNQTP
jgi:hypothetical protein